MSDYRLKIGEFASTEAGFQVQGVTSTNHSSSQKSRLNDLSCDMKIWTDLSSILSQSTRLTDRQADRRTEGQTELSSLDRVCIKCSAATTRCSAIAGRPRCRVH